MFSNLSFNDETSIKIQEVRRLLELGFASTQEAESQEIVLCMGPTRAGKSTLINKLLGISYGSNMDDTGDSFLLPVGDAIEPAKTSSGDESCTLSPALYHDKKIRSLLYCDMPGSYDNRDKTLALCSYFSVPFTIKRAKAIKAIIIVIDEGSLKTMRRKIFIDFFKHLSQIFGSEDIFEHSLDSLLGSMFLIFTKADPDLTPEKMSARLLAPLGDNPIKNIQDQLENKLEARKLSINKITQESKRTTASDEYMALVEELEDIEEEILHLRALLVISVFLKKYPDHLFLHDNKGNCDIVNLKSLLEQSRSFPTKQLSPVIDHSSMEQITKKAVGLLKQLQLYQEKQSEIEEKLNANEESISSLQTEIQRLTSLRDNKIITSDQKEAEFNNARAQINEIKEEVLKIQAKKRNLELQLLNIEQEIDRLSSSEVIPYLVQERSTRSQLWVNILSGVLEIATRLIPPVVPIPVGTGSNIGRGIGQIFKDTARFKYRGIPYSHVDKNQKPGTHFCNDEYQIPSQGIYSISYNCDDPDGGWAKISVMVEKRVLNKDKIDAEIQKKGDRAEKLAGLEEEERLLNERLERWQALLSELERKQLLDHERIIGCVNTDLLQKIQAKEHNALLKKQNEVSLRRVLNSIEYNIDWFEFIADLSSLFKFHMHHPIQEFTKLYKHEIAEERKQDREMMHTQAQFYQSQSVDYGLNRQLRAAQSGITRTSFFSPALASPSLSSSYPSASVSSSGSLLFSGYSESHYAGSRAESQGISSQIGNVDVSISSLSNSSPLMLSDIDNSSQSLGSTKLAAQASTSPLLHLDVMVKEETQRMRAPSVD